MSLHFAQTPPMGWNSWDCYGASVTEAEVIAHADFMAEHLKAYGWECRRIFNGANQKQSLQGND